MLCIKNIHIDYNLKLKKNNYNLDKKESPNEIRKRILKEMSGLFGDRIHSVATGSAPTPLQTITFMRECFPSFSEGYGSTETGNITRAGMKGDASNLKLRDVPELSYLTTDKPHPRGELLVRTNQLALGYYRDEKSTQDVFLPDGWFATGDIVEEKKKWGNCYY